MLSRVTISRLNPLRRTFFVKVSLWFWFGMMFVGAAFAISVAITEPSTFGRTEKAVIASLMPREAGHIVPAFEERGAASVTDTFNAAEALFGLRLMLYDESLHEVAGHADGVTVFRPALSRLLDRARSSRRTESETIAGAHVFVQPVVDKGRKTFYFALIYPSVLRRILHADFTAQFVRLAVCLTIGGLVCVWLAWNLTKPVRRLQLTARKLADGDLTTRVGDELLDRTDEFSELGKDFDTMASRLERLVEAHKHLLSDVSHELRSPLARLSVALGLARQKSGPETRELLDRIEWETERLNGLIGQLLSLARLESGTEFHRERFDLFLLMEEAVADGDFEARARGCRVELKGHGPYWIDGSVELLRSAIENIVRNAIRYSPPGKSIEASIDADGADNRNSICVTIRDHGPGVPEDALGHLFEPFFRVAPRLASATDGAGLGLAISRRAVHLHHGTLSAWNAPGGGLAVAICLPR
jgi:signal transduction histidine kinase